MAPARSRSFSRWVLLLGAPLFGASCTGLLDLNPQPEPPGFGSGTTGSNDVGMGTVPTGSTPNFNETGSAGASATGAMTLPDGTSTPSTGSGGTSAGAVTGAPGAAGALSGQAGTGLVVGAGGAGAATGSPSGGSANAAGGSSAGGSGGAEVGGAAGEDSGGAGGMAGAAGAGGMAGAGGAGGVSPMVSIAACHEYENQDIACLSPAVVIDSLIYSNGEVRGGYFADAECTEPLGAIEKAQAAPWVMRGTLQDTTQECLFEVGAPYLGELFTNSESDDCAAVAESPVIYESVNLYHIGAAFQGQLCE